MRSVLIIDDEPQILNTLKGLLEDENYRVLTAESGQSGLAQLEQEAVDVVLLDIWLGAMDGLQVLKEIKRRDANQVVVMMSGHGTIETAVKATKMGAFDYLEKPISIDRVLLILQNALLTQALVRDNEILRKQIRKRQQLIGQSQAMAQVMETVRKVAPTQGSVLITGENGTGKELVAHSIHQQSTRHSKPLIEVNCAAIPEELIESELFGHQRGAFTGAIQQRRGKFELANGGTLFLDEIGDMSLKTQAKVLRILQEHKYERVGGSETMTSDVRIVAATNKDLKVEILAGRFREDLYYRLNVVRIHLPPLRERKEDLPLLVEYFLTLFSHNHEKSFRKITTEAVKVFETYSWPGNVRELKNFIERLVILQDPAAADGSAGEWDPWLIKNELQLVCSVELDTAPAANAKEDRGLEEFVKFSEKELRSLKEARGQFEKEYIIKALESNNWNISKTAQLLGIERSYLHRKMKAYGIQDDS